MSEPLPSAPPPVLRGPLPRILVQWLPDEDLRRSARLRGGSAAESGEIRQIGVDYWHPLYAEFAAIADLAPAGAHLGSFLIQVGFRALTVQRGGAWMLDGPAAEAPGTDVVVRWTFEPSIEDVLTAARHCWVAADDGHTEDVRQRRIADVRALLEQDTVRREASIATAAKKLDEHPMFNMDRFNEVATVVEQPPDGLLRRVLHRVGLVRSGPPQYRPPGRLRMAWWAFRVWWASRRASGGAGGTP